MLSCARLCSVHISVKKPFHLVFFSTSSSKWNSPQQKKVPLREYYSYLGVTPDATQTEIREAYFRKVKQLHPDINPSETAKADFAFLKEAYKELCLSTRRLKYDKSLLSKPRGPEVQPETKEEADKKLSKARIDQQVILKTRQKLRPDRYWSSLYEFTQGGAQGLRLKRDLRKINRTKPPPEIEMLNKIHEKYRYELPETKQWGKRAILIVALTLLTVLATVIVKYNVYVKRKQEQ